jgi:hypothetical protein
MWANSTSLCDNLSLGNHIPTELRKKLDPKEQRKFWLVMIETYGIYDAGLFQFEELRGFGKQRICVRRFCPAIVLALRCIYNLDPA